MVASSISPIGTVVNSRVAHSDPTPRPRSLDPYRTRVRRRSSSPEIFVPGEGHAMRPVSFNDARGANRAVPPTAECPTPARRARLAPTIIRSNDPTRPVANSFRVEPMGGTVTRGRQVLQTCSGPGRLLQGQAEFRFPRELDKRFPPAVPRTTVHDPRLLR